MAARRIPLEKPPSNSDEVKLKHQQNLTRERIGANIRKLRNDAKISLRQMQLRSNVSTNYLSEIERGKRLGVSVDVLVRIAYYLNTTLAKLITD